MNAIPVTPLTLELARRIIWFEPPEQALSDQIRFMAYAMIYAHHEDMREIRRYVSDDDIRAALDNAPAGIIDPRSWAYWNARMPPRSPNLNAFSERDGGVSYLTLLNAERTYLGARESRAQAEAARYADTAALFQALGGGWWNRDNGKGSQQCTDS